LFKNVDKVYFTNFSKNKNQKPLMLVGFLIVKEGASVMTKEG